MRVRLITVYCANISLCQRSFLVLSDSFFGQDYRISRIVPAYEIQENFIYTARTCFSAFEHANAGLPALRNGDCLMLHSNRHASVRMSTRPQSFLASGHICWMYCLKTITGRATRHRVICTIKNTASQHPSQLPFAWHSPTQLPMLPRCHEQTRTLCYNAPVKQM